MYAPFARALPGPTGILAARLPGREARLSEPPYDTMDAFIDAFMPVVSALAQRPYALFGHSMGALMAYALVAALPEGVPKPQHLFLSAHRPPNLDLGREPFRDLPTDVFLQRVRAMGGIPDAAWNERELLDLVTPALRADFALCESFARGDVPGRMPIDVPITAFGGVDDGNASPEALEHWSHLTTDWRGCHIFAGGHFYIREHASPVLQIVARTLEPGARAEML